MAKIQLKPMDHMYDRRGRHLMNVITYMPVFVTEETEVEVDDDVAEATLVYIEENRKNFHTYLRPIQKVEVFIQPEPIQPEVKEDGKAQ